MDVLVFVEGYTDCLCAIDLVVIEQIDKRILSLRILHTALDHSQLKLDTLRKIFAVCCSQGESDDYLGVGRIYLGKISGDSSITIII